MAWQEKLVYKKRPTSIGRNAILGGKALLYAGFRMKSVLFRTAVEYHNKPNPAPCPYRPSKDLSPRLPIQSGVLLKMPKDCDLEKYIRDHFKKENQSDWGNTSRDVLIKIKIPDKGREDCLRFLNKMNISRLTLFPDLDGAAMYINSLWELNFDTALGHLPDKLND